MVVEKEYEYFFVDSPWLGYNLQREKHNSENSHFAHKNLLQ